MKSEILNEVANIVTEETEIPFDLIVSGIKSVEVVDARFLLVYALFKKGFYPNEISAFIKKRKRTTTRIITDFDRRLKSQKMLRIMYDRIKNRAGLN